LAQATLQTQVAFLLLASMALARCLPLHALCLCLGIGLLGSAQAEAEDAYKAAAFQRRMPVADPAQRLQTQCPHDAADLIPFEQMPATAEIVLPAGQRYLLSTPVQIASLTINAGSELVFADLPDLTLAVEKVTVIGKLSLGSESCPLLSPGIGITFASGGELVVDGGVLDLHGKPYAPTWTRLGQTAAGGSSLLRLQDPVDWEVGQDVLVVTTAWEDTPSKHENEVHRIASIAGGGLEVTLETPLAHEHYGGQEYAAEVALLSRSITLQGNDDSEATRKGGHTICKRGAVCRIRGVRAYRMGHENIMAKYPFHMHLMSDVQGTSYFEDCTVQRSFFRAFTIHGTSGARISRNVAYDVSGSAYYLEDGVEENNLLEFNLAAHVNIIRPLSHYGWGQDGVSLETEPGRILPVDATASGFYCTNPNNRWIGNSASGGFVGFHFPRVPKALGSSYAKNPSYEPESFDLLEFDSNTAHSSGWQWQEQGSCIYIGGKLWEEEPGSNHYSYSSGRDWTSRKAGHFRFTNTKAFACRLGLLFWGADGKQPSLMLEGWEVHDSWRSSSQLGETYIHGAVISSHTGNSAEDLPSHCSGFMLYDTDTRTIMADTTFRNFDRLDDECIIDMTHSNIMKQQGMFDVKGLRFENTPHSKRFRHDRWRACDTYHTDVCLDSCSGNCAGLSGSSQLSNIVDVDGSSGAGGGSMTNGLILGSDDSASETAGETNAWWRLDDECVHESDWGFFACHLWGGRGRRSISSLWLVKGIHDAPPSFDLRIDPDPMDGIVYHFGNAQRHLRLGLVGSPQITGACCDVGWYLHLPGGALSEITIFLDQMPADDGLVFSTSYPVGADLTVDRCVPHCSSVQQGSSLQEVLDSSGEVFFVDSQGRLFMKLVNEKADYFEAAGVRQLRMGFRWHWGLGIRYKVKSSKVGIEPRNIPDALLEVAAPCASCSTPMPPSEPLPSPRPTPTPPTPPPPPAPTPTIVPTSMPPTIACTKDKYAQCGGIGFAGDTCCPAGMWCMEGSEWWAQCEPCAETWDVRCSSATSSLETTQSPAPAGLLPTPAPSPPTSSLAPTSSPTPAPAAQAPTTAAPTEPETSSLAPTPSPTPAPTTPEPATSAPTPPTTACTKDKYAQCGGIGFAGDTCCPAGMWCMETSEWWAQCEPCAETWDVRCSNPASSFEPMNSPAPSPAALVPAPTQLVVSTTSPPTTACTNDDYDQCGGEGFGGNSCCPFGTWCMPTNQWWSLCQPCEQTWDSSCASAVAFGQQQHRMEVQSSNVAPHRLASHMGHGHQSDKQAHAFLARKVQRLRGMILLHVRSKLKRQDHIGNHEAHTEL